MAPQSPSSAGDPIDNRLGSTTTTAVSGQILDASIAAAAEQARREADRERWRGERARELAAVPPRPPRGPD